MPNENNNDTSVENSTATENNNADANVNTNSDSSNIADEQKTQEANTIPEADMPSFWLNEQNIEKFQLGYKIFLGLIVFMVLINVLVPLWMRRDKSYTVYRNGCFGIDINGACIGIAKYSREVRKDALYAE